MGKTIKALAIKTNSDKPYEEVEVESSLEGLQKFVGGYVEALTLDIPNQTDNRAVTIWLNEEGKLIGLESTAGLIQSNGVLLDLLCGNLLITSSDENGDTVSLNEHEMKAVKDLIKTKEASYVYPVLDGFIVVKRLIVFS